MNSAASSSTLYTILPLLPTPEQYDFLRRAASLTPPPPNLQATQKALSNSIASFLAFDTASMLNSATPSPGQAPVGMVRLIGDGALFLQVTDVAVHPDHQRRGLGKKLMKSVVEWVDENAPDAYVSLVADPMGQALYKGFGFDDCKPGLGMFRCRRIQGKRGSSGGEPEGER